MASAVVEVLGVFYFSTEVFASNITAKSESTSIIITNSQWPILIIYAAGEGEANCILPGHQYYII